MGNRGSARCAGEGQSGRRTVEVQQVILVGVVHFAHAFDVRHERLLVELRLAHRQLLQWSAVLERAIRSALRRAKPLRADLHESCQAAR